MPDAHAARGHAGPGLGASPDGLREPPVLVIRPDSARSLGIITDLWQFRDLLWALADRDLRLRYRQTVLGVAWVVLQPMLGALIFTFVFGVVAGLGSDGIPYLTFTFASLAGWGLFSGIVSRASGSLVQNSGLIGKVWFPRSVLPSSTVPAALVDLVVALLVLAMLMAWQGVAPTAAILTLPLWVALLVALALAIGFAASALMVRYRDVQHILPVALQLLLYASPVAYAASNVPERFRPLYQLNPLATALDGLRWSLLGAEAPPTPAVTLALLVTLGLLVLGTWMFRRMERGFADVI
jgi:lipopolysaccharide transport system permease protein